MTFKRKRKVGSFNTEVEAHLEIEAERLKEQGLSEEEARFAARRSFGNIMQAQEHFYESGRWTWWDHLAQDVRYGLRTLIRNPGFMAAATITLALGIGANTAIFSLIDAVMLRSLPVKNPSQLVLLRWTARHAPKTDGYWSSGDCANSLGIGASSTSNPQGCAFSEPLFRRIAETGVFSGIAAFADAGQLDLSGSGPATAIYGQLVSGDFFRTMGVKAAVGRVLEPSDDSPSAASVAVLNYGYWQSKFGGSREAVGRTIDLHNVPFTIVGVADSGFTGISPGSEYEVWLPLSAGQRISDARFWANRQDDAGYWWLSIVGRLQAGTGLGQAQAKVSGVFRNEVLHGPIPLFNGGEKRGGPGHQPGWSTGAEMESGQGTSSAADNPDIALVAAQSGLTGQRGRFSSPLYVLMLAVGIILLVACANVAGLMLARATSRKREMAMRLVLGAGRSRILRQLLTESATLSVLGGGLGILFAYWGAQAIISFVSTNQPRPLGFAIGVDARVLGFTVVVSLVTGILFGIAPAFRSMRVDLTPALKEGSVGVRGSGRLGGPWSNIGGALVVSQVMLAIVVLAGAGLLLRTLANIRNVDVGFDLRNLVIFRIDPTLAGYKDAQAQTFYRDLQGRLSETPGVKAASYSTVPPLSGGMMAAGFHWPGTPEGQISQADVLQVGTNFFKTLGIPFLAGRDFTTADFELAASNRAEAPTAAPTPVIVNQAFVENFLGKENPLGKQFGQAPAGANGPADPGHEIVGVIHNTKYKDPRRDIKATIYSPQTGAGASFELRTAGDPRAILSTIRKVVAQVDSNLPLFNVETASEQVDRLLFQERLIARLSGFFGMLALLLACIGLYGLLSYEGSRRTHEIGVRLALGASRSDVLRLVVGQGLRLIAVGLGLGVVGALALTRFMSSLLYGVKPTDPTTFFFVCLLLAGVALMASYIPARRATKVDPMVALRYE